MKKIEGISLVEIRGELLPPVRHFASRKLLESARNHIRESTIEIIATADVASNAGRENFMCTVIEDNDTTSVRLSLELEKAVVRHELDADGDLYVTEHGWYPHWVKVRRPSGCIVLYTHTEFRTKVTTHQRYEFCNEVNRKFTMLTASSVASRFVVDHSLIFRDGITRETFIRSCRVFSTNIKQAIDLLDPNNQILLAPGEVEPQESSNKEL